MQTGTVRCGHLRKWLHFDGVDDYVHIDEKLKTQGNDFTIIVLSENEEVAKLAYLFGNGGADRSPVLSYYTYQGSYYYQVGFDDTESNWHSRNAYLSKDEVLGKHFIAYSYTPGLMRLYIDDIKIEWTDFNYNILQGVPYKYIAYYDGVNWFKGNIYFVALYNRVLSDAEILQMYDYVVNGKGEMITDGLVLWLDGDSIDIENGIWHDKSGNGNDGTIYGATYNSNWGTIKYGTIHYGV